MSTTTTDLPTLLLPEEVAQALRCTRRTVLRHIRHGHLPAVRIAGRVRIRRADLLALIERDRDTTRTGTAG